MWAIPPALLGGMLAGGYGGYIIGYILFYFPGVIYVWWLFGLADIAPIAFAPRWATICGIYGTYFVGIRLWRSLSDYLVTFADGSSEIANKLFRRLHLNNVGLS